MDDVSVWRVPTTFIGPLWHARELQEVGRVMDRDCSINHPMTQLPAYRIFVWRQRTFAWIVSVCPGVTLTS